MKPSRVFVLWALAFCLLLTRGTGERCDVPADQQPAQQDATPSGASKDPTVVDEGEEQLRTLLAKYERLGMWNDQPWSPMTHKHHHIKRGEPAPEPAQEQKQGEEQGKAQEKEQGKEQREEQGKEQEQEPPIEPPSQPNTLNPEPIPWFCHQLDCPKYEQQNLTYELRVYKAAKWVSTTVDESMSIHAATIIGFRRLYKYIMGANDRGERIPMTAPVQTQVAAGEGPWSATNFTISFFIPFSLQDNPPQPSEKNVYIEDRPELKLAVDEFDGFARHGKAMEKAEQLQGVLDDAGVEYDDDEFSLSQYDPPFRFRNRHNEIWIKLKS
jgi:hypothetical protein